MRRRVSVLICALLVISVAGSTAPVSAQSSSDLEETRLEAQLQADGDARWTIVVTVPLEDERGVERFRSFAEAFENGDRDLQLGADAFRRAAENASEASGRSMSVHSEERDAALVNETEGGEVVSRHGELSVSFTWESFARVDENDTIYVDDAFNTTDGTWLPGLDAGQVLVIRSPPGYGGPSNAPRGPPIQDGDLRWEGPATFEPGYLEIVYQPTGSTTTTNGPDLSTVLLVGAVVLSAAALLLGVYLLWRRDSGSDSGPASGGAADRIVASEGAEAPGSSDGTTPSTRAGTGTGAGANGDGTGPEADPEQEPDLELLSDEERVEYLLERNGGRMKQATIVKETGWSNAKVSQLLSSMADEDRVDKLRIGRENLISLPGENVGDLAAEHDDE